MFTEIKSSKIFETKSSLRVKQRTKEKSLSATFWDIFATINKIISLAERLGTRLSFFEVQILS